MLERAFEPARGGTTVRTELLAGLTTLKAMACIISVNPSMLPDAGTVRDAVLVAELALLSAAHAPQSRHIARR